MTNTSQPLRRLAGAAFIAAPFLMVGGMVTSPPQDSDARIDYVRSLGADFDLTVLSADLFHYAWVLIALALPAVLTLLRGPKGRKLTTVSVVLAAFGAIQMSGLLLADWFNGASATIVPIADATRILDTISADPSLTVWRLSGIVFGVGALPLVAAGLARAGVLGWWTVPLLFLPMVVGPMLPGVAGPVAALLCYSPLMLIGLRLIRRSSTSVAAAEQTAAPALA
jgi:hypothetical protein